MILARSFAKNFIIIRCRRHKTLSLISYGNIYGGNGVKMAFGGKIMETLYAYF